MPFTPAHPAAVVPIWRLSRHRLGLSALIIGSMIPDAPLFFPTGVMRYQSHSLYGMFWFCLPAGLVAWFLFEVLLKRPLIWLMPDRIRVDIDATCPTTTLRELRRMRMWLIASTSIVVGSMTHIVWDALTHADGFGVVRFPFLRHLLFVFDGYHVYFYKILQHGSTWLGFALIAWWVSRWWRSLPIVESSSRHGGSGWRNAVIVLIVVVPVVAGMWWSLPSFKGPTVMLSLQAFSFAAVRTAVLAFLLCVLGYAMVWWVITRGRLNI